MKANELTLGDWVLYNPNVFIEDEYESPKDCYPTKINCGEDIDLAIEDCYNPIPLTAEILEKNGFVEFMPGNWQIVIDNIMIELREPEHNMAIWLDWDEHDTGTYASYMFPRPDCVHELQHALRLVEVEKEIEL